jgi:hypothetical protein
VRRQERDGAVRLRAGEHRPGALDTCFGAKGIAAIDVSGRDDFQTINATRVLSDKRVVSVGYARPTSGTGSEVFLASGSIDPSFGSSRAF